jgi:predicted RNA methylase
MDFISPSKIKNIAAKYGFVFKKGLGQNFLSSKSVLEEIAAAAEIDNEGVIEIGPGFGVLTHELAMRAKKVVALELDERLIPILDKVLVEERAEKSLQPVQLRMDKTSLKYSKYAVQSTEEDYDTEFLDYILAVKTVENIEEAVKHISSHSTHHSEAIVTEDKCAADIFTKSIDSAAVYVNASTRFTDGGVFGLGCEMGISTQKLHARGPMGLSELTTYKYVIIGDGHIR